VENAKAIPPYALSENFTLNKMADNKANHIFSIDFKGKYLFIKHKRYKKGKK
jgi:hypothetical protein